MKLCIIIPTHNRSESLLRCVKSVVECKGIKDYEIIIVDDGSRNDVSVRNKKNISRIRGNILYFYQKNKGQGSARNLGINKAKGDIIAFLDDDCEVDEGWFGELIAIFEDKDIKAVFGKILPKSNNAYSLVSYLSERHYEYKDRQRVFPSLVYNLAVRKSVLDKNKIRFIEERGKAEDIDFNHQLFLNDVNVVYSEKMLCRHNYPETFSDFLSDQRYFKRTARKLGVKYPKRSFFDKLSYIFIFPFRCFIYGIKVRVNPFKLFFLAVVQEGMQII